MSITNGEGTLNMGGIIYYYYFTALGEAYGGGLCILWRAFFSFLGVFFYMLLYHTWTLFPCKIGSWDAFVSIFQFD